VVRNCCDPLSLNACKHEGSEVDSHEESGVDCSDDSYFSLENAIKSEHKTNYAKLITQHSGLSLKDSSTKEKKRILKQDTKESAPFNY
jgi:hypothetical protein